MYRGIATKDIARHPSGAVRPSPFLYQYTPSPSHAPYPVMRSYYTVGYQPLPYTQRNELHVPRHPNGRLSPHQRVLGTSGGCTQTLPQPDVHRIGAYAKSAYQKIDDAMTNALQPGYRRHLNAITCSPLYRTLREQHRERYHPAFDPRRHH